jgi:hypothetical protein
VWGYILRSRRAHLNNFNINFIRGTENNLNAKNSGRIKIENEDFLMYDVPVDGQCFFHTLT